MLYLTEKSCEKMPLIAKWADELLLGETVRQIYNFFHQHPRKNNQIIKNKRTKTFKHIQKHQENRVRNWTYMHFRISKIKPSNWILERKDKWIRREVSRKYLNWPRGGGPVETMKWPNISMAGLRGKATEFTQCMCIYIGMLVKPALSWGGRIMGLRLAKATKKAH